MPIRRCFHVAVLVTSPGWASTARADVTAPRAAVGADLVALLDDGRAWLLGEGGRARAERPVDDTAAALIDLAPCATVVLRDWRGSFHVVGAPSLLLDEVRPAASSRMVLVRLASSGRLVSFAQIGAGEWRADPVLFPMLGASAELAFQVGGGLELRGPAGLGVAAEGWTMFLYGEGLGAELVPSVQAALRKPW